jgi:serine/threonine protein kinase
MLSKKWATRKYGPLYEGGIGDMAQDVECIQIERLIGKGSTCQVFYGTWGNQAIAFKVIDKYCDEIIQREIDILRQIHSHPNIVTYKGCLLAPNRCILATEFMCNGTVEDLFVHSRQRVAPSLLARMIFGSANGLSYLHRNQIIHGDFAARNIMIDATWTPRLADFGLSRILAVNEQSQETASDAGPIRWLPPEALENRTYSFKTDVFSFACVLYELYDRKTPWHDLSAAQVMLRVGSGQVLPPSKNMPDYIVGIMAACQQFTPADRPDMQEVVTKLRESIAK